MVAAQTNNLLLLSPSPIDTGAANEFVHTAAAGAIDMFLGTARAEQSPDGRPLIALMYEAYLPMTEKVCHAIIDEARARWPVLRCAMVHRIGRVELGEVSILVAVACPHRAEAFDACRFIIDQLKERAPIWKEPIWGERSHT